MSTAALRTDCPDLGDRVHDAPDWVADRQILVQRGVFAVQGTFDVCALYYWSNSPSSER